MRTIIIRIGSRVGGELLAASALASAAASMSSKTPVFYEHNRIGRASNAEVTAAGLSVQIDAFRPNGGVHYAEPSIRIKSRRGSEITSCTIDSISLVHAPSDPSLPPIDWQIDMDKLAKEASEGYKRAGNWLNGGEL